MQLKSVKFKKKNLAAVVAAFVIVGSVLLFKLYAAGPLASFEAESSTLNGAASVGSDTNASGGRYVQFGGTISSRYIWHHAGYDGGGRGEVAAIDPLNSGNAALGGDVWGEYTTLDHGNFWNPRMWGVGGNGIGDIWARAAAYSIKNPGTVYWGIGVLKNASGGGGFFGTTPAGTSYLQKTNTSIGFTSNQTETKPAALTPRALGRLIIVDYDSSSRIEYIYALTNHGLQRSTDSGRTFTAIGSSFAGVVDNAWKALALAPDGSLYAANFGYRSSDASSTGQHVWRITNPRTTTGSASDISEVTGSLPTPINDLTTVNGVLWATTAHGLYKLVNGSWQGISANSSTFSNSALILSTLDGTGSTIYVGSADVPSGSQQWVAKSSDGGSTWRWVTSTATISNTIQGTSRPFWLPTNTLMPADNFGIEHLVVDPHDPNFVLMATFRGAYATLNGGALWQPTLNGLSGTEANNVGVGSGGNAYNSDTDWGGPGGRWAQIVTSNHYCTVSGSNTAQAFTDQGLGPKTGHDGKSYTITGPSGGRPADITQNGTSIADDYFRADVIDPTDYQIAADGTVYVGLFNGGVLIGTPPGLSASCP